MIVRCGLIVDCTINQLTLLPLPPNCCSLGGDIDMWTSTTPAYILLHRTTSYQWEEFGRKSLFQGLFIFPTTPLCPLSYIPHSPLVKLDKPQADTQYLYERECSWSWQLSLCIVHIPQSARLQSVLSTA